MKPGRNTAAFVNVADARDRARQIVEMTGLRADQPARALGTPGRKRLEIARVLAAEPRLLLLIFRLMELAAQSAPIPDGHGRGGRDEISEIWKRAKMLFLDIGAMKSERVRLDSIISLHRKRWEERRDTGPGHRGGAGAGSRSGFLVRKSPYFLICANRGAEDKKTRKFSSAAVGGPKKYGVISKRTPRCGLGPSRIPPRSSRAGRAGDSVNLIAETSSLGYLVRAPPLPGARAFWMKTGFAVVTTAT